MVDIRNIELGLEKYVLPSQCEHVFYVHVLGKEGWSYVVKYDHRGRLVKYNVEEGEEIE